MIEQEEREREERRQREEEERILAVQREQERRVREEAERQAREERARIEQEKKDKLASRSTSGVRGIRGTRAQQMRGAATTRGLSRTGKWCPLSLLLLLAQSSVRLICRDATVNDSQGRYSSDHRQRWC